MEALVRCRALVCLLAFSCGRDALLQVPDPAPIEVAPLPDPAPRAARLSGWVLANDARWERFWQYPGWAGEGVGTWAYFQGTYFPQPTDVIPTAVTAPL